jgi:predicted Zn-dependent protease with MMP-like domain
MRGPAVLTPAPGAPVLPTSGERFDTLVLDVVADLEDRWADRLGLVEYAVEDAPQIPDDWHPETIPLSSLVRGARGAPTRLVLFRRPIEHRAETRSDLEALVLTVLVEQVAELLGIDAELVDPRYRPRD